MGERNAGTSPENRIEFRVGINLGDVIAEAEDTFGDGVIGVATVGHRRKLLQAITAAADCPEITAVSGRPATAPRASPRLGYGTPHRKRGRAASSKRVRHTRSNGLGSTASRSVWARNVPSNK